MGSFMAQLLPFFPQAGAEHCLCSHRDQVLLSLENPHATGLRTLWGACAEGSVTVFMARSGAPRKIVTTETMRKLWRSFSRTHYLIRITSKEILRHSVYPQFDCQVIFALSSRFKVKSGVRF